MADDDSKTDKKSRHELAMARFKLAAEAYSSQRARELEALKFASLDQWPDDIRIPAGRGRDAGDTFQRGAAALSHH